MNLIELNMMKGMVSILNDAYEAYHINQNPIITNEQYDVRLKDLIQLEEETGFMFFNSPNCKADIKTIITENSVGSSEICNNVEDIIKFSNQNEMIAYIDFDGIYMSVTYNDGIMTEVKIGNSILNIKKINNLPYKINKEGAYIVEGKAILSDKIEFFVDNVVEGGISSTYDNLSEAESLNFNVVSRWIVKDLNPKKIQNSIDYIFDYDKNDELPFNRIAFKFNDIKYCDSISNKIIYQKIMEESYECK